MFDLDPYGINLSLKAGMNLESELGLDIVNTGYFSRSKGTFTFVSGKYSMGSFLGKGTYGESFQAIHSTDNTVSVVKVINRTDIASEVLKECIINIILEKVTRNQPYGPYVPQFYEVAYDDARNLILIRMERLHGTLGDLYNGSTPLQNDFNVLETLGDLSAILDFLHDKVKFNHRDLKSDNVMYNIVNVAGQDKIVVKLIDFGFSCLTWNGITVSGNSYFPPTSRCYIPWRDLCQFVYEINRSYGKRFSSKILHFLQDLLTFDVGNDTCKMHEGCQITKRIGVSRWRDTYDFLSSRKVKNPKCVPSKVHDIVMRMLGRRLKKTPTPIEPVKRVGTPAEVKKCLPEQVLNPKTRRCVRRDGAVGRKIINATHRRSPSPVAVTRRRHQGRKPTADLVPCKSHQERNPLTRRCRNKPKSRTPCAPNKIRNPRTGRCVRRDSKVGQLAEAAVGVRRLEEFFPPAAAKK